jgi:hypothetical protein
MPDAFSVTNFVLEPARLQKTPEPWAIALPDFAGSLRKKFIVVPAGPSIRLVGTSATEVSIETMDGITPQPIKSKKGARKYPVIFRIEKW